MAHMAVNPVTLEMVEIIAHATVALDGKENAMAWLQKPNAAMGGRTPISVLSQGDRAEIHQLDEQLTALEYGMHP